MYLSTSAISLLLEPKKITFVDVPIGGAFDRGFDAGFVIGSQLEGAILLETGDRILLEDGTGVILKG